MRKNGGKGGLGTECEAKEGSRMRRCRLMICVLMGDAVLMECDALSDV